MLTLYKVKAFREPKIRLNMDREHKIYLEWNGMRRKWRPNQVLSRVKRMKARGFYVPR